MNSSSDYRPRKPLAVAWGEAIREQRKALGMTQAALAADVGVEQPTISKWERGQGIPSPQMQARLVKALGIDQVRWYQIQQRGAA